MATMTRACPFSNRVCTECALYRGRHHYLFPLSSPLNPALPPPNLTGGDEELRNDFLALKEFPEPWTGKHHETEDEPKIRLKVIDMENGTSRTCDLEEVKKWSWGNPRIWRLIDGRQVATFDHLMEILHFKAERGHEEIEIYEAPRFMMLAGG